MKTPRYQAITHAVIAATLAVAGPVMAADEEDEVAKLTKPESSVSVGAAVLANDSPRFGMYTGMNDGGIYGLVDIDITNRDDETGTWLKLYGRNLGLQSRELRFDHAHQGDWGYFVEFNQIPRYSPYVVNTGLSGIGSASQNINGQPMRDVELKTQRDILALGFDKQLSSRFDFRIGFRNEEKQGSRLFGRTGPNFLAEPIDSVTRQMEATIGYTGEQLQLSGGYYGSFYANNHGGLVIDGVTNGGAAVYSPIGLPPDNESHQFSLAGGYSHTPTTRSTFKLSYGRTTQDDTFIVPSLLGYASLDGRVDTTQAQLGISSSPIPKLSLLANVRYENRDDKTPVRLYSSLAAATSTFNGFYEPRSLKTTAGKLEAGYQLPLGLRVLGGVDQEHKERNIPHWFDGALAAVSTREETDETTYRIELRRSLSETVNGALRYAQSRRDGSDYLTTVRNDGSAGSNLVAPLHLADRDRDLWRLSLDWAPTEPLSIQLVAELANDEYSGRTLGPRDGSAKNYSVDIAYIFSDKWQSTAWLSRNDSRMDQTSCEAASALGVCPNTAADPLWSASLRNLGDAIGFGLRGKFSDAWDMGADIQYSYDRAEFGINAVPPAGVTTPPDVHYKLTTLKLFNRYALDKRSGIKISYVFEYFTTDDWTWTNWVYSDGTRVTQDPKQTAHVIGAAYYYGWR